MSDVDTALTGADAAPVSDEAAKPVEGQENPQVSADAEQEVPKDDKPRDEKGQFVQKRINELTRKFYDEQRARESLERELQQYKQQPARAPDPEQDLEGYLDHVANERAQELVKREREQWTQQQESQRIQSLVQQSAVREVEYAKAHPDYMEAADTLRSVMGVNPAVAEVMLSSEHGPAVAHYLGTHLDEAVALSRMPSPQAIAAIIRLEAKVSAPKPKPVSNAPNPAHVLDGGGSAVQKDPERMSTDEWLGWRRDQLKAK